MTSLAGHTNDDTPKQGIGAHKPRPSVSGAANTVPALVIPSVLNGFDKWLAEGSAVNMVVKKPLRHWRVALRYWYPRRLTLPCNPRVHAWLWWNF